MMTEAKLRQQQQQQGFLEASPTTCNETEESTKDAESVERNENTNELLNTAVTTEGGERRPGEDEAEEKQEINTEMSEGKTEDCDENKENKKSSETPHSLPNINSQVIKTVAEGDNKPKLIHKMKDIQYPIAENETLPPEQNSNMGTKDKNTDEEGTTSSQHSTEEEPKSSHSPAHQKLLTDDPLIAEKASELIEFIKTQKHRQSGLREYVTLTFKVL